MVSVMFNGLIVNNTNYEFLIKNLAISWGFWINSPSSIYSKDSFFFNAECKSGLLGTEASIEWVLKDKDIHNIFEEVVLKLYFDVSSLRVANVFLNANISNLPIKFSVKKDTNQNFISFFIEEC